MTWVVCVYNKQIMTWVVCVYNKQIMTWVVCVYNKQIIHGLFVYIINYSMGCFCI